MFGHKPLEVHPQIAYGEIHRIFHELSNNVFRFATASKNVRKGEKNVGEREGVGVCCI